MMKLSSKFSLSSKWKMLLLDMGIDPTSVLTHARLPLDSFNRSDVQLSVDEYFSLWRGIEAAAGDQEVALLLAKYISAESFDAPIFAALCCKDLNTALNRLSHYKPLIGPMVLTVDADENQTKLQLKGAFETSDIPYALCMSEAVFFTQLARIGTRERVCPTSVSVPMTPRQKDAYEAYFGCKVIPADNLEICFKAKDAAQPFLTSSGSMWSFFEEKLNKQLEDLTSDATTTDRVKSILIKALPSGEVSIEFVAEKLAMSKRTLQRKLTEEAETFQSLLLAVREELAQHYLEKSDMSLGEISYLLGFKEPNSFIRAFNSWKGISPNGLPRTVSVRASLKCALYSRLLFGEVELVATSPNCFLSDDQLRIFCPCKA